MSNKLERILEQFFRIYPCVPIDVYRSSIHPEINDYLKAFNAEASASYNLDTGRIDIQILDDKFRKAAIYEELSHALQMHKDGNVYSNTIEYWMREIEVAECMLERVKKGNLSLEDDEIEQTRTNLDFYYQYVTNLRGGHYE